MWRRLDSNFNWHCQSEHKQKNVRWIDSHLRKKNIHQTHFKYRIEVIALFFLFCSPFYLLSFLCYSTDSVYCIHSFWMIDFLLRWCHFLFLPLPKNKLFMSPLVSPVTILTQKTFLLFLPIRTHCLRSIQAQFRFFQREHIQRQIQCDFYSIFIFSLAKFRIVCFFTMKNMNFVAFWLPIEHTSMGWALQTVFGFFFCFTICLHYTQLLSACWFVVNRE